MNRRRALVLEFKDGMLKLPTRAGLGFDFDATEVARYSLGGKSNSWAELT